MGKINNKGMLQGGRPHTEISLNMFAMTSCDKTICTSPFIVISSNLCVRSCSHFLDVKFAKLHGLHVEWKVEQKRFAICSLSHVMIT